MWHLLHYTFLQALHKFLVFNSYLFLIRCSKFRICFKTKLEHVYTACREKYIKETKIKCTQNAISLLLVPAPAPILTFVYLINFSRLNFMPDPQVNFKKLLEEHFHRLVAPPIVLMPYL